MNKIFAGATIHGSRDLGAVVVETYNAELRDTEGFIGDRASNRAFRAILDDLRDRLRKVGEDPLGEEPTEEISKKKLDKMLGEGDPQAAGVVHGAIETFAAEFSAVIARFLKLKGWRDTERIVVGGGLRASRIGELVIGRASVLLKEAGHKIDLVPIQHHPDEAALIGAVHLAPPALFEGFDGILAVDIGGSKMRAGLVAFNSKSAHKKRDYGKCTVVELDRWRYADDAEKPTRDAAVNKIGQMLARLVKRADDQLKLAPFIGVACPGIIAPDGQIERGGQNLPGNWESSRFNLPERIREKLPRVGDYETLVVMHNDAVVQGLSQIPLTQDVDHWGVLTIGTGLGNAAFTNRHEKD
ncbi:MAG TPA: ROK family protein [Polyangia bacterium]|nr:ROK family protein [Polyangia bacterium]